MRCSQCYYENLPDAVYCENCGTGLAHICLQCQTDNRVSSTFCRKCGTLLTRQSPTPRSSLLEGPQKVPASHPPQIAPLLTEQSISEVERRESMEIIYPRCGGVRVERRRVVACLCLYQADGQVHREIRMFGTKTWELLVLSDWLVTQGATQVAIASTGVHWPRVARVLEQALTVRLSTEVMDVELMVDLLAHGLLPDSRASPPPLRALPHHRRLTLVVVVSVLVAAFLTTSWWWRHPRQMDANAQDAEPPAVQPPPHLVRWQSPRVFYPQPAGTPFTLPLPSLERTPEGLAVEVTPDASGDWPSWLHFDREALRISGTAPTMTGDRMYHLSFNATTADGGDSRLSFDLMITGQPAARLPPPPEPSRPTPPGSVRWQPLQVAYQHLAGEPFTFRLPALERAPEGIPVGVTLETTRATPSWLQLDHAGSHISGTAPITAAGQTYRLIVRAQAEDGSESRLLVDVTIRGQPEPPLAPAKAPSPAPPRAPEPLPRDRPLEEGHVLDLFSESRSPLRAQTAPTLETWRPTIAFPYTQPGFTRLQSNWPATLSTTLTHKLINDGGPSLSGPFRFRFESEGIRLNSDFEIEHNAFLAATYDLSRTWNMGLSVPIFPVHRFGTRSQPNMVHNFGPWSASHRTPGDADDVSIGNVVFQTHYNFPPKRPGWPELGILSLVTLPTADRDSLPGMRETNFLTLLMASRSFGRLAPHVNLGFDWTRNGSEQHSLLYGVGLTANVQPNLTLALDVFGRRGPAEDGIEEHAVDLALGATWHLIPGFLLSANARLLMNHRDDLSRGIISTVGFEYKF